MKCLNKVNDDSSGSCFNFHNSCKLRLPFITIFQQFGLIVKELLVEEGWVLEVRTFHDCVNWASFLTEATENAFCHINIIFSSSSRSVWSWLRLNHNCESRASSFAKFASDASFLTCWVSSESVLTSEHRWQSSFFPRVMNNMIRLEARPCCQEKWWPRQLSHYKWFVHSLSDVCGIKIIRKFISHG